MNRFLPLAFRMLPRLAKTSVLAFTMYNLTIYKNKYLHMYQCSTIKQQQIDPINTILPQVVKVTLDGSTFGYAFCFEENVLVTASPSLMLNQKKIKKLEFIQNEVVVANQYKVQGHFENLTFIRLLNPKKTISPMPAVNHTQKVSIIPVQVVLKKSFLLIKNGYLVNRDAGFGIVAGHGEVGSIVINKDRAVGVVSHIGRDQQIGFLRIVSWQGIKNVYKKLQKQPKKLGISTSSFQDRDGLSVSRISLNSPLKDKLVMGDIIVKVNHQTIRNADDLSRIIFLSDDNIKLKIQRDGKFLHVDLAL